MTDSDTRSRRALYKREYRARQKRTEDLILKGGQVVFTKSLDVLKEMIRAANSNPLMGMVASVVMADILARAKIIDNGTAAGIWAIVGTIEGAEIAGTLISDFTDIFKIFSKSPTQDLMRPSATTIVYGNSEGEDLQALMNKE
jgi:hypothetical protein